MLVRLAVAAGMFPLAPASAQDYPARDVGDWTVAVSADQSGCFATREYDRPGKTTLLFGLDVDGGNYLSVLNQNWSIKPKDRLDLDFQLSGGSTYPKHSVVGLASNGKRGFVTNFDAAFPPRLAASKSLRITRDAVPVEQLSLDGSGAAIAELRTCVALFRANDVPENRGKERSERIPRDPFAPHLGRRSKE